MNTKFEDLPEATGNIVYIRRVDMDSLPDEVRGLLEQGCKGFLQKPFRIPELLSAIRRSVRPGGGRKRG